MKLTKAQRRALEVIAGEDKPVGGWREATRDREGGRLPLVNYIAAGSLERAGLARRHVGRFNAYAHTDTYSVTDAGRAELE